MRYAIFSDIHGNLPAWEQVLADIRALDADVLICLGDVVGYGPKPQEVLDGIREVTDNFVLGNHDAAAAGLIDPAMFNDHAHSVVLWTRDNLTDESLEFIQNMPLELSTDETGTDEILFVHAELTEPGRFGYIEEVADAEEGFASRDQFLTFIGHTHHPLIFEQLPFGAVQSLPDTDRILDPKCRYIVNVGSAGEPRDPDDIRARYVIYDSDTRQIYFRRIEFNADAYRRDLEETSLTHTPYFLRVLEDQTGTLAAARARDMKVPAQAARGFNTTQRTLDLTGRVSGSAGKPKPVPYSPKEKKSAGLIFLIIGSLAVICFGGWFFLKSRFDTTESIPGELIADTSSILSSSVRDPKMGKATEVTDIEVPHSIRETDTTGVAGAGASVAAIVVPKVTTTSSQFGSTPKQVQQEPEPTPTQTVAHWTMNSESVEGDLLSLDNGVSLRQVFPPRPFDKIAPDPIPQTGEANPSALARGGWEEKEPGGKFALTPNHSFTFEGWVLISPGQPPVFVGGTTVTDRPGWRLDIKSGKTTEGTGSIRFQYSNGDNLITAQNNEIPINLPEPHHFATIWHHEGVSPEVGMVLVYFDGELVAKTELAHSLISSSSPSTFLLSSATNPERIAMDEVRFTRGRLRVKEFLFNEPGPNPGGVVTESGLTRGRLLYAVDDGQFDYADAYTKDNSPEIAPGSFTRVGYFVELGDDWVWVSMDRFQKDPKLLGVPRANSKIVENGTLVKNLVIESSRDDLNALNRPGLTGIIEFWASNHTANGGGKYGSNDAKWDWKDSGGTTKAGHGSFQVFAFTSDEQNKAVTLFGITKNGGAGIGDQPGNSNNGKRASDWTFGPGTKTYRKRNLEIWVGN